MAHDLQQVMVGRERVKSVQKEEEEPIDNTQYHSIQSRLSLMNT